MCHLQEMYEDYREKGLEVLGINCSDDLDIALEFLADNGAEFPNVLDDGADVKRLVFEELQTMSSSAVPMSYVVDREGKIASRWYGKHQGSRVRDILRGLGIE